MIDKKASYTLATSKRLKAELEKDWRAKNQKRFEPEFTNKRQYRARCELINECLKFINSTDSTNSWRFVHNKTSGYYKIMEYQGSELINTEFKSKDLAEVVAYLSSARTFLMQHTNF